MKKKILLLHGWNNQNYTKMTTSNDSWENRIKFVNELSKYYDVYKINFPGFCGEPEPDSAWYLEDYASLVNNYIKKSKIKFDYILGYSFGGAVAVKYAYQYNQKQPLILISPAIKRIANHSNHFIKTPRFLNKIRNKARWFYLIKIKKNPYYLTGTKFLNESYNNIVRVEVLDELNKLDNTNNMIIFGNKDSMVDTKINTNCQIYYLDGGHDLANTNTKELIDLIR